MQTSDEINEIAAALAKAQGEFPKIAKNKVADAKGVSKRTGQAYSIKYAYADIADVLAAILPVLSKHSIALVQPTAIDDRGMTIHTRIIHSSGQWMGSVYPVCAINGDHQIMGSAITYARRYAACSLIGVAADDDLDGEDTKDDTRAKGNGKDDAVISDMQVSDLRGKIAAVGADEQRFLKFLKVGSLAALPAREFERAMSELNRKVQK
jgi:ERF superfamily protein